MCTCVGMFCFPVWIIRCNKAKNTKFDKWRGKVLKNNNNMHRVLELKKKKKRRKQENFKVHSETVTKCILNDFFLFFWANYGRLRAEECYGQQLEHLQASVCVCVTPIHVIHVLQYCCAVCTILAFGVFHLSWVRCCWLVGFCCWPLTCLDWRNGGLFVVDNLSSCQNCHHECDKWCDMLAVCQLLTTFCLLCCFIGLSRVR